MDYDSADDLLGDYPAVQYVPPDGTFHLDILTRLGQTFQFSDLETERVAFDGLTATVVTPRMLYRMKRDAVRPEHRGARRGAGPLQQLPDMLRIHQGVVVDEGGAGRLEETPAEFLVLGMVQVSA